MLTNTFTELVAHQERKLSKHVRPLSKAELAAQRNRRRLIPAELYERAVACDTHEELHAEDRQAIGELLKDYDLEFPYLSQRKAARRAYLESTVESIDKRLEEARLAGLEATTPAQQALIAESTKSLGARCPYCGMKIGMYIDKNWLVYNGDWNNRPCEHQVWLKGMIFQWPDKIDFDSIDDDFEIPFWGLFGCHPALKGYESENFFFKSSRPQRPRAPHKVGQLFCRIPGHTENGIAQYALKGRVCFARDPEAYVSELVELFESSRRGVRLRIHKKGS